MIHKVTNANFSASIDITADVVSVVLLFDPYGECGSVHQQALADLEAAFLYYQQYSLPSVLFFKGDVADRTMVETDIKNVQCAPSFYFYVGDGVGYAEYYRNNGILSVEQIQYYIEQKRG